MSFASIDFLIFLSLVCLVYYIIPHRVRKIFLLYCSYVFYMWWNASYALLMLASTVITFCCGIGMDYVEKQSRPGLRKNILCLGILLNLGILFFFKYFNFCFGTMDKVLTFLGAKATGITIDLLLPIGISFYTFQVIGYMIDVYRGDVKAERNFVDYAIFISFFPQLLAGPIGRSKNLLEQIKEKHKFSINNFQMGVWYIAWGYFLKLVIADRIAIFVDLVYTNLDVYVGLYIVFATILFAVQIYCDFNGYTMIARGAARILGFELIDNFSAPYLSQTVAEFWRKWHISLTSWFRDYLYIPLGGNRRGKYRKYINTLFVFLSSGLWHGASWGYVIWGGLNGIYMLIEDLLFTHRKQEKTKNRVFSHKIVNLVKTFLLVDFSWIFFRAAGIKESYIAIKNMFTYFNPEIFFDGSIISVWMSSTEMLFLAIAVIVLVWVDYMKYKGIDVLQKIMGQEFWFRVLVFNILVVVVFMLGIYGQDYDSSKFIYFQF